MNYEYTKTNIIVETLEFEINESSIITTELKGVTFTEPDNLEIEFDSSLSSEEKTELDSIVSNHTGQTLQGYRIYCVPEADYRSFKFNTTPTKCPACESTNINNIVAHDPPTISTVDELGQAWDLFILSDGSIITARRY